MLLQIMEEGQLSDAKGQKVNFRNAMIILTSNVGAEVLKKGGGLGFSFKQDAATLVEENYRDMQKKLMEQLKRSFRPEFLNRLDSVIVFRQLQPEDIRKIVDIQISDVNERMDEHFLVLEATDAAKDWLATHGYDAEYGARPLRRLIQQTVEDKLSDAVLAGEFNEGETVIVDVADDEIILRHAEPEEVEELLEPM
jgi:ATP-dependent Clp protease ATP-binding subunit ClpC